MPVTTNTPGKLYIVATPIGNLEDITLRALNILKSVDIIACEDTRVSHKLLAHYGINVQLLPLHKYNENQGSEIFLNKILASQNIALISDAGTPLISDPGYKLVSLAREQNIEVIPIPGACAFVTALSAAGLPSDELRFSGFLPTRKKLKQQYLQNLSNDSATLIFYEAPHRLLTTLEDMHEIFGPDRNIVVAKELTKMFENFYCGTLHEVMHKLSSIKIQGEFVILVAGNKEAEKPTIDLQQAINIVKILKTELKPNKALQIASQITGIPKNKLFDILLSLK